MTSKALHRKEQQEGRDDRDQRRQDQDAQAVVQHRIAQGPGFHRHFDQRARLLHRIADHPDDPVLRVEEQAEGIADQLPRAGHAQVERVIDLARDGEDRTSCRTSSRRRTTL
jgi:hypothetical protein